MGGRLDLLVHGLPASLVAESQNLTLTVANWGAIIALRQLPPSIVRHLRNIFERGHIRFCVQHAWLGRFEIFPRPAFLTKSLLPEFWR